MVARVGGTAVTKGMVDHWVAVEERGGVRLVPPEFAACVASLKKAPIPAVVAGSGAKLPLRASCEVQYAQLRQEALDRFIVGDWLAGGARELGVEPSGPVFERELAAITKRTFHSQAKLQSYLASSGRTPADLRFLVRMELDSAAIRAALARRVGPVTAARVRAYYSQHKSDYYVPETRDLGIVGTSTRAEGLAARRKIASGESFANVVKGLHGAQPVSSKEGEAVGLVSGFYKEPALNDAVFTAKPGVLTGPIKTVIGYYLFSVKKIHPAEQKPLSAVAASIERSLPETLSQQTLVDYIKAWRAKWTTKTNCVTGYIAPKCRQYKAPATSTEDAYTLN